jgi:N6-adenosine-specific RNA methylase IME4
MRRKNMIDVKDKVKKYKTLYVDPPWNETGGGKIKRGADKHYPLMKTKEIIGMSRFISKLTDDDAHLYLWATNNHLQDALDVMSAWGFRYVTMITWQKDKFGLGQYYRGKTEHCLFGVKGKVPYKVIDGKRQQGVTGFTAPRDKHSKKPEEMRFMIEKVSYPPYIEMFARESHEGWDAWGNEVEHTIYNK